MFLALFALEQPPQKTEKSNIFQTKLLPSSTSYLVETLFGNFTPLYWSFGPLFFCHLLQIFQIWWIPSLNTVFEISAQVIYGLSSTLSNHFLGDCRTARPMTSDGDTAFWQWAIHCAQNSMAAFRFHNAVHTSWNIQCPKQKNNPKTSVKFRLDRVLFLKMWEDCDLCSTEMWS